MSPAQQIDDTRRVSKPKPPHMWPTGVRHWVPKEGLRWGIYWTVRSRWINAVARAAYEQRVDEWKRGF